MLNHTTIRKMHNFVKSADIFPSVDIKDNVSYFLSDNMYNGKCEIITVTKNDTE